MKQCPKCSLVVAEDAWLCKCGYEFANSEVIGRLDKITPGCFGCLGAVLLLVVLPVAMVALSAWNRLRAPERRQPYAVDITISDESNRPIAGATLHYDEHEIVVLVPLLPFGPYGTIHNMLSVTTNDEGKAHINTKYNASGLHVSRAGKKLTVIKSETTPTAPGRKGGPQQKGKDQGAATTSVPFLPQWLYGYRGSYHSGIIVRLGTDN